jgi:hypothetical protein
MIRSSGTPPTRPNWTSKLMDLSSTTSVERKEVCSPTYWASDKNSVLRTSSNKKLKLKKLNLTLPSLHVELVGSD